LTTAEVYPVEDEAQVVRRVGRHFEKRTYHDERAVRAVAVGYEAADLEVLRASLR
jgi:integrase/recombinase XerD